MSWLSPYAVSIPEDELDDLRARLARTRWIDDFPDTAWDLGVSRVYLQELCEYWRTTFDWRAQESLLNSYSQYLVDVDGQSIHFVHARSAQPDALPLLLIHGWPGSVFEYIKVLDPLSRPESFGADAADSFHVVAPSIPGYGFSGPTRRPGWGPVRIASAFAELMHRLGYERYAVAGGDWGAIIGTELARMDGGVHVCGLHLTMPLGLPPSDGDLDVLSPSDQQGLDDWARHQAAGNVVHVPVNSTRPHTLAFGLNDSPAGLAAWLIDKYRVVQRLQRRRRSGIHPGRVAHRGQHLLVDRHHRLRIPALLRAGRRHPQRRVDRSADPRSDRVCDLSEGRPSRTEVVGRPCVRQHRALDRDVSRRPLPWVGAARAPGRRTAELLSRPPRRRHRVTE